MSVNNQAFYVGFMDAYLEKNLLWFVNKGKDELFNYNFATQKLTFVAELNNEDQRLPMMPRRIIKCRNFLYFVSNNGFKICKGYIRGEDFIFTSFFENDSLSVIVKEAFFIDDRIHCIPSNINQPIVVFDIEKECFKEEKSLACLCRQSNVTVENANIMTIKYFNGKYYFTLEQGKSLIECDIKSKQIVEYFISDEINISGFEVDGNNFWLRGKTGISLYKWNPQEGIIGNYLLRDMDELERSERNAKVISTSNGRIILLPTFSDSIVYLDEKEGCLKRVRSKEKFAHLSGLEKATFSIGNMETDNELFLFPWSEEKLICIDLGTMEARSCPMKISQESLDKKQWLQWKRHIIQYESEDNRLNTKIELIKKNDLSEEGNKRFGGNVGKNIYNKIGSVLTDNSP